MATALVFQPGDAFEMMSRPQIGIDRLPARRMSGEPKEAMNCKSCRKRKIKCNRLRPSCEACQVFNCTCIYDAVPKKRGPKTDVLESLLKRVNGLERRLKDEERSKSPGAAPVDSVEVNQAEWGNSRADRESEDTSPRQTHEKRRRSDSQTANSGSQTRETIAFTDALLNTYFTHINSKPYYILDESATRQRLRDGHLPRFLINAIHAVSLRYVPHLCGGHNGAARSSEEYARQSRAEIDVDEPSIDHLQALLLLTMANFQSGKGKKSHMLLSHAISMAFALSLHRELPSQLKIASIEREGRRKLFWTCYVMDRFMVAGSKRPALIADESVCLRLPAWQPSGTRMLVDGDHFPNGSSLSHPSGVSSAGQGSGAMLVTIARILGIANRYLAIGGVKGDSHFPWHGQSTLSRIRLDLDHWAASTQDAFTSLEALFGQPDSSTLVLSKLVYHLIHCLIYRPFLPVDLTELSGPSQHQSWQIEATNLCFMHANAIVELVEIGKNTGIIYWPSFVGYCVCTAGTVHVHGAHYIAMQDGDLFANSAHCLSREMSHISDLRFIWAGVQHQRETLSVVYTSHSRLVQSLAHSPMRFSPVFQMEDFFDRYPGSYIDGAHVTFTDVAMDALPWSLQSHGGVASDMQFGTNLLPNPETRSVNGGGIPPIVPSQSVSQRPVKRRRTTNESSYPYPTPNGELTTDPLEAYRPNNMNEDEHAPHHAMHDNQIQGQDQDHGQDQTLSQSALSPSFTFSPLTQNMVMQNQGIREDQPLYDAHTVDDLTPSAVSVGVDSAHPEGDTDPFLSLLEQLAENDGTGAGGPSELDFFSTGQG